MKTYNIKAVLFDMDGVLIDSNDEIEKFWRHWTVTEGLDFTNETVVKYIHGRTTLETINELFINSSKPVKEQIYKAAIDFDMNMRPGLVRDVDEFLKNLIIYSKKIALVTSAPKTRAKKILELNSIYNCFTCFVTGDEVIAGKPNPEAYLKAALKMNLHAEECLVFEDSNNGILSALAAGMYVIAVNNYEIKNERIIARITDFCKLKVYNSTIKVGDEPVNIKLAS